MSVWGQFRLFFFSCVIFDHFFHLLVDDNDDGDEDIFSTEIENWMIKHVNHLEEYVAWSLVAIIK